MPVVAAVRGWMTSVHVLKLYEILPWGFFNNKTLKRRTTPVMVFSVTCI